MSAGLHDHPGLFPHLPARDLDPEQLEFMAVPRSEFRKAWEFVLHDLTDSERSAFWHGVNIQHGVDVPDDTSAEPERQRWERRQLGVDLGLHLEVEPDGRIRIHEAVLAQLLVDAGWERTA